MDNKLGRELPVRLEFENNGFINVDGVIVEGVRNLLISFCDDEITLQNKDNYVVGTIYGISERKECVFGELLGNYEYSEHVIIKNGEVILEE